MSAGLGIGAILAAISLPGMLLGSLARAHVAPGFLATALNVAAIVSGIGLLRGTGTPVGGGRAHAWPWHAAMPLSPQLGTSGASTPVSNGYVRSLLGGSVPLLPPPRP